MTQMLHVSATKLDKLKCETLNESTLQESNSRWMPSRNSPNGSMHKHVLGARVEISAYIGIMHRGHHVVIHSIRSAMILGDDLSIEKHKNRV